MESDQRSQGEFPDQVGADGAETGPKHAMPERPGEYTDSEIPGEPEHVAAEPGAGQYTDSQLADEPDAAEHHPLGQYTDSQLADEPDAAGHDAPGEYTERG